MLHSSSDDLFSLWAAEVAAHADFPDERLNTRFAVVLESLAAKPTDSFPQASQSKAKAKALYRFIANNRLDIDHFEQPLVDTAVDRMRGLKTVLAIQDSTSANYSTLKKTTGLGKLNDSDALGLHIHSTIAVRLDGVACGLLHQEHWSRPPELEPIADERNDKPIADKESRKWLDGIDAAEAARDSLPMDERPRLIHVMDREGDIHEVLERIGDTTDGAVIRIAQSHRCVAGSCGNIAEAVASAAPIATVKVEIPIGDGKHRVATLQLRSVVVTTAPNSRKHPHRQPLTWTVVEAKEIGVPADVEPMRWLLWTTEPAGTAEEIMEILHIYKLRWLIEDFHLTLKSGCQIEELRLETADRLCKAILMYSHVALRIVSLRDLARRTPDAPCTEVLIPLQWQMLFKRFTGKHADDNTPVPTIKQAVLWIGQLGGYLPRKKQMPGVRVLWRGWRDMEIMLTGFLLGK